MREAGDGEGAVVCRRNGVRSKCVARCTLREEMAEEGGCGPLISSH